MTFAQRLRGIGPSLLLGLILATLANVFLTGGPPIAHRQMLEADVLGAQSVTLRLRTNTGQVEVVPMTWTEGDLLRASVMHFGDLYFRVTGREERVIVIEDRSSRPFYNLTRAEDLDWRVRLNPEVPLSLDYATQSASSALDLRAFRLRDLVVEGGTGPLTALLPLPDERYEVVWRGGSGLSEIVLPQGAAAELRLSAANAQIMGLERQPSAGSAGGEVWRTPHFDAAAPHIFIRLDSPGEVRLRLDEQP